MQNSSWNGKDTLPSKLTFCTGALHWQWTEHGYFLVLDNFLQFWGDSNEYPQHMSPVKRICVFEHSVMTNFTCACPAIQRGQGSGFLSEGSSWFTACMSEQRRSGETARMRRLAWTFTARIGDKYQIRLTRSNYVVLFYGQIWKLWLNYHQMPPLKSVSLIWALNIVKPQIHHTSYHEIHQFIFGPNLNLGWLPRTLASILAESWRLLR